MKRLRLKLVGAILKFLPVQWTCTIPFNAGLAEIPVRWQWLQGVLSVEILED